MLVAIVSIVWGLTVEPALRGGVAAHQQEVAGRAADQIQEFMELRIAELAAATELGRLWREKSDSRKEILYRLLKLAPTVQEVRLADREGRVVFRLARHRVYTGADLGVSVEAEPGFRRAVAGGVHVGDVFHGATAEPMVRVAMPIKFTATDIRGVLLAEINLKTLWDPIADLKVGQGGSTFVLDRAGRLIAHRDYSRVLLGVSLADHPAFRLARAGARDNGHHVEGGRRPSDGERVISAFAIVPRTGWVVIVEEPEATALAGVTRVKRIAAALTFVALLGSFGLSYWFSARIARPIRQLQDGAARISRGDLRHRLEITAGDEIEALAREFNDMAEQLRLSREGLERKVAEKTRDLSALYALVTPLSRSRHLEETLNAALAKIMEITGADGGLIRISGPDRAEVLETSRPPSLQALLAEVSAPEGDEPLIIADTCRDPHTTDGPLARDGLGAAALLPLTAGDKTVGVVILVSRRVGGFGLHPPEFFGALSRQVGMAVENVRLFTEAQRRREAVEALLEISRALGSTLDLHAVLKIIAQRTARAVGAQRCSVNLMQGARLVPVMSQFADGHADSQQWEQFKAIRPERLEDVPAHTEAIRTRSPVVIEDTTASAAIPASWRETFGVQSAMVLPLIHQDQVVGTMTVDQPQPSAWSRYQIDLAVTIASQAALALQNASLYQHAEARAEKLKTLSSLTRLMISASDAGQVFDAVARAAATLLGAKLTRVWVDDPTERVLRVRASVAADAETTEASQGFTTVAYGGGLVGAVLADRQPVYVVDLHQDSRVINRQLADARGLYAFAGIPLITGDRVIGVLAMVFGEARGFSGEERELMQLLADQAAIAIEKAELIGKLQEAVATIEASQQRIVQTERLRALGEMAGGVAHDFNNALAIILGRTRLLLSQTGDPELERQMKIIDRAASDAAQTVRRIQEFTRMRRARPFQQVNLSQIVEDIRGLTQSRWKDEAEARNVAYDVVVEPGIVPPTMGDPSELREAITNLLFNALDAMPEGGRVTLRTGVEGTRVYCRVTDTGVGMTDEVKRRVFDPFFTTKHEKGTGLGLSIVHGIVTRHGGEVDVESRVGHGSTFTIWLPVVEGKMESAVAVSIPQETRAGRILVVDDEAEVGEVLRDYLASRGHAVSAFSDAEAALARLQGEWFDLVITDLGMPKVTGWEVARRVKLRSPGTPVMLLTGWGEQLNPDEARAKGVDFVLAKPFGFESIQAVLAEVLAPPGGRGLSPRAAPTLSG